MAKGMACTCHRVFLACLIMSAKNLNDSSPKNKYWARYTQGLFSLPEVNLMEKQLLYLLDWDLRVNEQDLYRHLQPFLIPIKIELKKEELRRKEIKREEEQEMYYQKVDRQHIQPLHYQTQQSIMSYPSPPVSPYRASHTITPPPLLSTTPSPYNTSSPEYTPPNSAKYGYSVSENTAPKKHQKCNSYKVLVKR